MIRIPLLSVLSLTSLMVEGDILEVPGSYPTITSAVEASSDWDTVLVFPGIYQRCTILNKKVTIGSLTMITGDPAFVDQTVVQAGNGSVFFIDAFDVGWSVVELNGLTLRNGQGTYWPEFFFDSLYHGGGICAHLSHVFLRNMVIANNSADEGGGIGNLWSYIYTDNVVLKENYASMQGGGYHGMQGTCLLTNSLITGNVCSDYGGGVMSEAASVQMVNCRIIGNQADRGGGIFSSGYDLILSDCLIQANQAQLEGGGIVMTWWTAAPVPGNPELYGDVKFVNLTICGNSAPLIGGVIIVFDTEIFNSVIWGNTSAQVSNSATLSVYYSDIEGGLAGIQNYGVIADYVQNIDVYPQFADTLTGDYSLRRGSPCVNAGKPDTTGLFLPDYDLAGKARIVRDTVDMGAYEFQFRRKLELKAFMEGPYNVYSGNMENHLFALHCLPENQPFNVALPYFGNPEPAWYYQGNEKAASLNNPAVIDWVLVELRETQWKSDSAFISPSRKQQKAGFILENGQVVDTDGFSLIELNDPVFDSAYIAVFHRNHLGVMSALSVFMDDSTIFYNFTDSQSKAYQISSVFPPLNIPGHKEIAPGIFGFFAADGNADFRITGPDKTQIWDIQAGQTGYLPADFNLDGFVNNRDKNDCWRGNSGVGADREE